MKLIIYKEGRAEELPLEENTVVGRNPSCDLQMDDAGLSGTHAEFIVDGETVTLRDLNSTNGTFVNDERIMERVLRDGDRIILGKLSIFFSAVAATPAGAAAASQLVAPPTSYTEDEPTPVDDDFAPEEEKPSGAPRPELLSREGKWYLRENVTGKEVEIVPVRKDASREPSVALSSFSDFLLKHSLVAAGVIVVFGLALALLLRSILIKPPTPPGAWSLQQYAAAVRRSLVEFDAGELGRAEYFLARAADKYRHNDLANLLLSVVSVWRDDRHQDLREVERVLGAVGKYAGKDFADVSNWAADKQAGIRRDHKQEATMSEIEDLVASGQLKEALAMLDKISEGSRWYDEAQKMTRELSDTISRGFLGLARRAMQTEDWKKALDLLQQATDMGASAAYIQRDITVCRRNERDKGTLARAREHFGAQRFEAAARSLSLISAGSRYYTQAGALRADIKRARLVGTAERFYNRGDKRGALAALKDKEYDLACAALKQRILDVTKAFDDAEKLLDDGRPDDAIELWEEITRLEANERNYYRSRADRQLDKWRDHPENLAQLYLDKAVTAEIKADYLSVRKWLEKGLEADPGNEACVIKMADLKKDAVRLMNEALVMRNKDRQRALKMFTQVTHMLPADDPYAKQAQREIKRLKRKKK